VKRVTHEIQISGDEEMRVVTASKQQNVGVICALGAYAFWGLVPIYFKSVGHVSSLEILSHRVIWSVPLTALLITLANDWHGLRKSLSLKGVWRTLSVTALLVTTNWLVFIYAVNTGRLLQASLGYYINPLVNVLLGVLFLKERLRPLQVVAVLLATAGTANITIQYGRFPWIALVLAFSFGTYGLLRKTVRIEAVNGLFVETALVCPIALAYLIHLETTGTLAFGTVDTKTTVLLFLAGAVTTFPLVWFTMASRRLRYSTMGLLQYLAPSLMFLLAVFRYGEPFTLANYITFGCIWTGLAIYVFDSFNRNASGAGKETLVKK